MFENMPPLWVILAQYAGLLFCLSVHESAHSLTAFWFGDETSKLQGRITLNPLAHIDIFGTIIFPLLAMSTGFPVIGWAKPVMVNPINLKDPKRDDIFISASGPISNLLVAFILTVLIPVIKPLIADNPPILTFYYTAIQINVLLAFFNLVPIPPLDGSGILKGILPDHLSDKYEKLEPFGFIILYAFLLTGLFGKTVWPLTLIFFDSLFHTAGLL